MILVGRSICLLETQGRCKIIGSNNPVAAALLSKMNCSAEEKVSVKIEFARRLANMRLDLVRNTMRAVFFETYLRLDEAEEQKYRERLPRELKPEEVRSFMEITTSYHQQGREEGIKEGKREVALAALKKGLALEDIMEITGLDQEKLLEIQKDSATAGGGNQ